MAGRVGLMVFKTYVLHCSVVPVMVSGSLFAWNTTAKLEKKSGLESRDLQLCSYPSHANGRDAPGLRIYSTL